MVSLYCCFSSSLYSSDETCDSSPSALKPRASRFRTENVVVCRSFVHSSRRTYPNSSQWSSEQRHSFIERIRHILAIDVLACSMKYSSKPSLKFIGTLSQFSVNIDWRISSSPWYDLTSRRVDRWSAWFAIGLFGGNSSTASNDIQIRAAVLSCYQSMKTAPKCPYDHIYPLIICF